MRNRSLFRHSRPSSAFSRQSAHSKAVQLARFRLGRQLSRLVELRRRIVECYSIALTASLSLCSVYSEPIRSLPRG